MKVAATPAPRGAPAPDEPLRALRRVALAAVHPGGEALYDDLVAELADDPDLQSEIQSAIDDANKAVSHAEAIKKFRILDVDWTEEGGQMTPSRKLKRAVIMSEFAADIDALYA